MRRKTKTELDFKGMNGKDDSAAFHHIFERTTHITIKHNIYIFK